MGTTLGTEDYDDRGDSDVCVALTANVKLCEDHFVVDTLLVLKKKKGKNMMMMLVLVMMVMLLVIVIVVIVMVMVILILMVVLTLRMVREPVIYVLAEFVR